MAGCFKTGGNVTGFRTGGKSGDGGSDRETRRGLFIQSLEARTINREGPQIFLGSPTGRAVRMIPASLERRDRDFVPEGDENAADVDWTAFVASPLSFPPAAGAKPETAWPQGGDSLYWHGESYTVTGVRKVDKGDVTTALRIVVYRTPEADAKTVEAATGRRKTYQPADATI